MTLQPTSEGGAAGADNGAPIATDEEVEEQSRTRDLPYARVGGANVIVAKEKPSLAMVSYNGPGASGESLSSDP